MKSVELTARLLAASYFKINRLVIQKFKKHVNYRKTSYKIGMTNIQKRLAAILKNYGGNENL